MEAWKMSKALADISFVDLLPASIASDETMTAAARMLDTELGSIEGQISNILIWSRIEELQEPMLSYLAWQLHVDYWRPDMILLEKRDLLKRSFMLHSVKGTPGAIEDAMAAAVKSIGSARVVEWFEYGGDPYHFKVSVDIIGELIGGNLENELLRIIAFFKNCRSRLDAIEYNLSAKGEVPAWAGVLYAGEIITTS
jgi:phage tail P2-like protein